MKTRLTLILLFSLGCEDHPAPDGDAGATDAGVLFDGGVDPADGGNDCSSDCPEGQCFGARCVIEPEAECATDEDCGDGQRCSVAGLCFEGACQTHADCNAAQRCHTGRCLDRPTNAAGVQFERVYIDELQDHVSTPPLPADQVEDMMFAGGTGFGVALLDIDGDLDLDIFLGSEGGISPCLYENRSRPSQPLFVRVEQYCSQPGGYWHGGSSTDLEGDGQHELIRFGTGRIEVQRFGTNPSTQNLMDTLPEGDIRRDCNVGSATPHDFNYDGRIDLMVGCQFDMLNGTLETFRNLLFLQDEQGLLQFIDQEEWVGSEGVLHELTSSTLALGLADLNEDGLGDVIVNEDVLVHLVHEEPDPGGVYFACAPDEDCRFSVQRFARGDRANGAYMGSGVLRLGDHAAHHIYISDIAENRLIRMADSGFRDVTRSANAGVGYLGGQDIYGWGVVIDDFDYDGRDDIYLGNGAIPGHTVGVYGMHLDLALLQKESGRFGWYSADIGIDPFTTQDSSHPERAFSTRAIVKGDLDNDQMIDIISAGMEGAPRIHREVPLAESTNKRCSLVPMPRYVPGHGSGHQVIRPDDPRARLWDSQGQVRSGTSPFIVTPAVQGTLVFPSGASVPFDCEGTYRPVLVFEPEWINLSRVEDQLIVMTGAEAPAGDLAILSEGKEIVPAVQTEAGVWAIPYPSESSRVMLRFGDRWTARWFEVP